MEFRLQAACVPAGTGRLKAGLQRVVIESEHDDAADTFEDVLWMLIRILSSREIIHLAGVAVIKPVEKLMNATGRDCRSESNQFNCRARRRQF